MNKNISRYFFHWEPIIIIISLIVNALLFSLFIYSICIDNFFNQISILLVIIGASMFVPIKLSFDSKSLKIYRPIGKIHIRYQDIKSCYVIDCDNLDDYIRTCGSGGVYGLLGYFKHEKYGKVRFFVTDRHQCFIIRMKNGKNYMISSPGYDNIVMVINEYLKYH